MTMTQFEVNLVTCQNNHEKSMTKLNDEMRVKLRERGREMAIYPDDADLIRWYNDCLQDRQKQYSRDLQDIYRDAARAKEDALKSD